MELFFAGGEGGFGWDVCHFCALLALDAHLRGAQRRESTSAESTGSQPSQSEVVRWCYSEIWGTGAVIRLDFCASDAE